TLAEQQARAILQVLPTHPEALLIQGIARRLQGDAPGARDLLADLARAQPRSARTHYELALSLAALGETQAAIAALRRVLALAPAMSDAWRALGDVLMLAGETEAADAAYARHIRTAVNDPELMRAGDALCAGNLPRAEHVLKARLKRTPTDIAAIRMLAETATRLGRYRDAENLLRRCLELAPGFAPARHNFAVVLFRQSRAAEAIPHIRQLLEQAPNDPNYRNLLAAALAVNGDYREAIAAYEDVLRDFPLQPKIWLGYGHALRTEGRRADCVAAYRRSLELAPSLGEAYWSLANLKTGALAAADTAAMRAALSRADLAEDDRLHVHFALGRALEDAADYAESFAQYAAGAKIRRQQVHYDAAETASLVARVAAFFNATFLAAHAEDGHTDDAPIFVVGLPRSGSTLVEQVLASHGSVEGTLELPDIGLIARDFRRAAGDPTSYPEGLATLDAAALAELGQRYIDRTLVHRKRGRARFVDKMPNNWVHFGLIRLILPNAKIIDARRHPMAACFSNFKQHFARGQHFSYDLTELGRYYRDYVSLMDHFDRVLPGRVHRVQYETMVADTDREIRRLLDFCELPFEPACLRFWETERAVRTASSEQVRRPIYREGLDQWRHFEPWLSPLRAALQGPAPPAP
ncbi:MAG TPA: sulfotransferase, partial [Acetobacteraceae bacterium]|nr:sulfotransferase [Acetobacteraceae bacterium]